jgi:DNA-binding PadR family transcriptional regulator
MKSSTTQRSGLALAVLALLVEEPMHPYRMQQLIKERGKDDVINVGQRSQLYKTIERLMRDGLITEHATERDSARPERTVYGATDTGKAIAIDWTVDMLTKPRKDFPEFTAALAYLPLITPKVAVEALRHRLEDLRASLTAMDDQCSAVAATLPRIFLVESEYMMAHLRVDIDWIESLVKDIEGDKLGWNVETFQKFIN